MTRVLKFSGFLGLTIQMLWGMSNVAMVINGGVPAEIVGAHAHFGVLGILAVVMGFGVDHYNPQGWRRSLATWGYIIGQWLLPATLVVQYVTGAPQIGMLEFIWGILLFLAVGTMAWQAWSKPQGGSPGPAAGTAAVQSDD